LLNFKQGDDELKMTDNVMSLIMQFFDKDYAIKQSVLASLRKKPEQTTQEICDSINNDDDLRLSKIIASLSLEKKIKSAGYVFLEREDGGTILVQKYSAS